MTDQPKPVVDANVISDRTRADERVRELQNILAVYIATDTIIDAFDLLPNPEKKRAGSLHEIPRWAVEKWNHPVVDVYLWVFHDGPAPANGEAVDESPESAAGVMRANAKRFDFDWLTTLAALQCMRPKMPLRQTWDRLSKQYADHAKRDLNVGIWDEIIAKHLQQKEERKNKVAQKRQRRGPRKWIKTAVTEKTGDEVKEGEQPTKPPTKTTEK